jgi:branched-chain amino acid transport system permease protein
MGQRASIAARTFSTPIILALILGVIALGAYLAHSGPLNQTVIDIFIRVILVVGLYVFIGNSGVMSFGHIGFVCLGAYTTAWLTALPVMKTSMKNLPQFLHDAHYPFYVGVIAGGVFAALFAAVVGKILMRLSGIAASIATFAMLAVINQVYSNWDSVTGGTGSFGGLPINRSIWPYFIAAVIAIFIAWGYAISRSGLALRAARDEATAAAASGVDIPRERLIAFVISAFLTGAGGALFAHSVGIVTPDTFFLAFTFTSLSMLVVGGMNSLSGAVSGVVVLSILIEVLRWLEKGVIIGGATLSIPLGLQEIAIGVIMIVILMYRPSGLTRNREFGWKGWPFNKLSGSSG